MGGKYGIMLFQVDLSRWVFSDVGHLGKWSALHLVIVQGARMIRPTLSKSARQNLQSTHYKKRSLGTTSII